MWCWDHLNVIQDWTQVRPLFEFSKLSKQVWKSSFLAITEDKQDTKVWVLTKLAIYQPVVLWSFPVLLHPESSQRGAGATIGSPARDWKIGLGKETSKREILHWLATSTGEEVVPMSGDCGPPWEYTDILKTLLASMGLLEELNIAHCRKVFWLFWHH